ncbi:MAG: hypothetical protein NTY53_10335 [Kiritimatiellaeota bacterium]|nr:hypothetical protein [Kiritimatiellota bacterium]
MNTEYLVPLTPELRKIIGKQEKGRRIFRREGSFKKAGMWHQQLHHKVGALVSPGGVIMYANVSRAGVYRAIKEGKITAFCFHAVEDQKTIFGRQYKLKERAFVYVPVSECKAWAKELEDRAEYIEKIKGKSPAELLAMARELERLQGTEKDRDDHEFLLVDPEDKGKKDVKYKPEVSASDLAAAVVGIPVSMVKQKIHEMQIRKRARKLQSKQG